MGSNTTEGAKPFTSVAPNPRAFGPVSACRGLVEECHEPIEVLTGRRQADRGTERSHRAIAETRAEAGRRERAFQARSRAPSIDPERLFGGAGIAKTAPADRDPPVARGMLDSLVIEDAAVADQVEGDGAARALMS